MLMIPCGADECVANFNGVVISCRRGEGVRMMNRITSLIVNSHVVIISHLMKKEYS